jgi:hypothetical protein
LGNQLFKRYFNEGGKGVMRGREWYGKWEIEGIFIEKQKYLNKCRRYARN